MTIATCGELKVALATWAHRDDLDSVLGDCITLAESRMYDLLLLRDMEQETTLTGTIGSSTVSLPTGYVSPIALWILISSVRTELTQILPEQLAYDPSSTQPTYWAIDGDSIRFDCPLASAYTFKFRFMQKSNLTADDDTNYLLTRKPDLYLAGGMVEIARYAQDAAQMSIWEPKFQQAVNELKSTENRSRKVQLRTEFSSPRSNIFTGE